MQPEEPLHVPDAGFPLFDPNFLAKQSAISVFDPGYLIHALLPLVSRQWAESGRETLQTNAVTASPGLALLHHTLLCTRLLYRHAQSVDKKLKEELLQRVDAHFFLPDLSIRDGRANPILKEMEGIIEELKA